MRRAIARERSPDKRKKKNREIARSRSLSYDLVANPWITGGRFRSIRDARYRSPPENAADTRRASRRPVGDRCRRKIDRVSGSICLLPTRLAICGKTGRLPVGRRPADNGGSLLISFGGRGLPRDGPFVTVSRRHRRRTAARFYARERTLRD